MKCNFKKLVYRLSFLACLFSFSHDMHAQEESRSMGKGSATFGIGFPEHFPNVGLRFVTSPETQLGISAGKGSSKDGFMNTVFILDFMYHFAGTAKLSEQKPWFGRFKYIFLNREDETEKEKITALNLRVGRVMNISPRVGLELDFGVSFTISYNRERKTTSNGFDFDIWKWNEDPMPSTSIGIFYRL